jgi:hypothetical protein
MEQAGVPKRLHIKYRRRIIDEKEECNVSYNVILRSTSYVSQVLFSMGRGESSNKHICTFLTSSLGHLYP